MAEIIDDIAHLSQEIGPRPAGTEEEQQAALYIADELQKSAGFSTVVEDFQCSTNSELPNIICFALALAATIVPMFLPVAAIPCFIVLALVVVLLGLEIMQKPVLSRFFKSGVSQNVVAKYQPAQNSPSPRRRKVILVANYDSGKSLKAEQGVIGANMHIITLVVLGALALDTLLMFVRMIFFTGAGGPVDVVFNVLMGICALLFVVPIAKSALRMAAPYNQSANNNASGVAVMLDVARNVGNGLVSNEDLEALAADEDISVHGEDAAREAGVIPNGARVEYEARPMSSKESLAAAKAAIAALTGKPVADKVPVMDISSKLVQNGGLYPEDENAEASNIHFEVSEPVVVPAPEYTRSAPVKEEARAEEAAPAEPAEEPSSGAAPAAAAAVTATATAAAVGTAAAATTAAASFERTTPVALQAGQTGAMPAVSSDKTPAWARSAQAKAHANKPDLNNPRPSGHRSRYADTVAAQLTNEASAPAANPWADTQPKEEQQTELSARLAALRSEIESTEAPHLSTSAKEQLDSMEAVPTEEPAPAAEAAPVVPAPAPAQEVAHREPAVRTKPAAREAASVQQEEPAQSNAVEAVAADQEEQPAVSGHRVSFRSRAAKPRVSRETKAAVAQEPIQEPVVPAAEAPVHAEEQAEAPVPANKTAAISPIDVSQFMNKEPEVEERPARVAVEYSVPAAAPEEEKTQKVSKTKIKEAIQDAEEHISEYTAESSVEPAPKQVSPLAASLPEAPVAPIVGLDSLPEVPESAPAEEAAPARQVIVLPDVMTSHATSADDMKQRAPMADSYNDTKAGTRSLLSNMLPSIGSNAATEEEPKDTFGLNLPALGEEPEQGAVSATGAFAPVGDELVADIAPEERYVEDADESAFEENYTETGAFAGPDYVDMPKSRAGRLFSRFRKKDKKKSNDSVREWVGADEDYEARSVGKARGDWSSFRQDDEVDGTTTLPVQQQSGAYVDAYDGGMEEDYIDVDYDSNNDRRWNGGAFSLSRFRKQNAPEEELQEQPYMDEAYDVYEEETEAEVYGEDFIEASPAVRVDGDSSTVAQINREMHKMQNFRHPDINTEVWFVALGSEYYSHSGIKAFLAEHADEMRGAIIVNLEGLGAGDLTFFEQEGVVKPVKPSSRMKRVLRQASERSGVTFKNGVMDARETTASIAMANGVQAMTIAGVHGNNTAYYSDDNDVIENVNERNLEEASSFVISILKSI